MKRLKQIWVLLTSDIDIEFAFEFELPSYISTWGFRFEETDTDALKALSEYYGCHAALYINIFVFEFRIFLR